MRFLTSMPLALLLALGCTMACSDDDEPGKGDSAVTVPDKGAPDQFLILDSGPYTGPNAGNLCKTDTDCKNAQEKCLFGGSSLSYGMCLMTCTPGTTCPKPLGNYAASCAFSYKSGGGTSYACGWYCQYQGKMYNCPNSTDYTCWTPNSTEPYTQFCVPK